LVAFAGFSGDRNLMHTNKEFARSSPFGQRILHGPATFAIVTGLESQLGPKNGTAIAFLGMPRSLSAPALIDDTIHVSQSVAAKRVSRKPNPGGRDVRRDGAELAKRDVPERARRRLVQASLPGYWDGVSTAARACVKSSMRTCGGAACPERRRPIDGRVL